MVACHQTNNECIKTRQHKLDAPHDWYVDEYLASEELYYSDQQLKTLEI